MDKDGAEALVVVVDADTLRQLLAFVSELDLSEEEKWLVLCYYLGEYQRGLQQQ